MSKAYPDFDDGDFEAQYESLSRYNHSCAGILKKSEGVIPNPPCHDCPHHDTGSNPSFVTGLLPAPSAQHGHHPLKAQGEDVIIVKSKVVVADVINTFINTHNILRSAGRLYHWNGTYWEELLKSVSTQQLTSILPLFRDIPNGGMLNEKDSEALMKHFKNCIADVKQFDTSLVDNTRYINFTSGVYDIETEEIYQHSEELYCFDAPVYNYTTIAPSGWLQFISKLFPSQQEQLLLQVFFGLSLSNIPNNEYQQLLWLEGAPGTGKSTILTILQNLLGAKNYVTVSATECPSVADGVKIDFVKKKLMFIDDYASITQTMDKKWGGFLRPFVSGQPQPHKQLFNDLVDVVPQCTVLVTSNDPPPIMDKQDGLNRRIRTLHTQHMPTDVDGLLPKKLMAEADGIIHWALQGISYYKKHGMPEASAVEKAERGFLHVEVISMVEQFIDLSLEQVGMEVETNVETIWNLYTRRNPNALKYSSYNKFCRTFRKIIKFKTPNYSAKCFEQKGKELFVKGIRIRGRD